MLHRTTLQRKLFENGCQGVSDPWPNESPFGSAPDPILGLPELLGPARMCQDNIIGCHAYSLSDVS